MERLHVHNDPPANHLSGVLEMIRDFRTATRRAKAKSYEIRRCEWPAANVSGLYNFYALPRNVRQSSGLVIHTAPQCAMRLLALARGGLAGVMCDGPYIKIYTGNRKAEAKRARALPLMMPEHA